MATEKKTTTTTTTTTKAKVKEQPDFSQIEELLAKIKQLEEQVQNKSQVIVTQDKGFSGKKIKCINLMQNPISVSTEPNGEGRVYYWERYGQTLLIKFDDLSDIVASYPRTMEQGLIYITNSDVVEELGLTEEYKNLYTKDMMDSVLNLNDEYAIDLFNGMPTALKESVSVEMAKKIKDGHVYDLNLLNKIKETSGFDIMNLSNEIKKEETK